MAAVFSIKNKHDSDWNHNLWNWSHISNTERGGGLHNLGSIHVIQWKICLYKEHKLNSVRMMMTCLKPTGRGTSPFLSSAEGGEGWLCSQTSREHERRGNRWEHEKKTHHMSTTTTNMETSVTRKLGKRDY